MERLVRLAPIRTRSVVSCWPLVMEYVCAENEKSLQHMIGR
jgi:hypothetical protein